MRRYKSRKIENESVSRTVILLLNIDTINYAIPITNMAIFIYKYPQNPTQKSKQNGLQPSKPFFKFHCCVLNFFPFGKPF